MGKAKRLREQRAAAARNPSVTVAVFSTAHSGDRKYDADVAVAKAALLYADRVDLYSATATLHLQALTELGTATPADMIDLAAAAKVMDVEAVASAQKAVAAMQAVAATPLLGAEEQQKAQAMLKELDQFSGLAADAVEQQMVEWGGEPLREAAASGALQFKEFSLDRFLNTNPENASRLLKRQIADITHPRHGLVLPLFTGDITGLLQTPDSPLNHVDAKHAATAHHQIARLHAFPRATMSEVLDIRTALDRSLTHYRATVAALAREMTGSPVGSVEFDRHLNRVWMEQVEPAIAAIDEEVRADRYLHQLSLLPEAATVAAAGATGVLLAAINHDMPAVIDAVANTVSVGAPTALSLRTAQQRHQRKHTREVSPPKFYYLQQVQQRIN